MLLVVFVVGLAFANSISASRVTDNARALHWANSSLGTAALTRAALVQAATFAELEAADLVTADDLAAAMTEARGARERLDALGDSSGESVSGASLTHYLSSVDDTIEALDSGGISDAKALIVSDVESAYIALVDSLQAEQDQIQTQIDANNAGANRATDFMVFFLTFAIPASAVLIYRLIAKRAVREHKLAADLEIEAERAVGRAKDEFIAGLSHELRTPLTSIYGFAEILTDGDGSDVEGNKDLAQIIANEAAEMTRMVDDLLAAARIDSTGVHIEFAPTRISDVVESAVTPFARAGLEVKRSGGEAWVSTDAARLRHVIVNLLSNAARHGGDNIGIEVSGGDGVVDIEVWDDGPGVPEEQVERLFERFIHDGTAPLLTGSIGLGLAVASRLTALLGGKLSYQRFVGKSYFIVSLPGLEKVAEEESGSRESVAEMIRAMSA
ncbi:MAG TPA: HAMP domain-containing sensor histidine kinase [Acidimicrobiia bacterium]|nr:HAMP domain-containing sensor histidine kinase [Acidimicrobiia bacterium]